jgi:hypothetical protein
VRTATGRCSINTQRISCCCWVACCGPLAAMAHGSCDLPLHAGRGPRHALTVVQTAKCIWPDCTSNSQSVRRKLNGMGKQTTATALAGVRASTPIPKRKPMFLGAVPVEAWAAVANRRQGVVNVHQGAHQPLTCPQPRPLWCNDSTSSASVRGVAPCGSARGSASKPESRRHHERMSFLPRVRLVVLQIERNEYTLFNQRTQEKPLKVVQLVDVVLHKHCSIHRGREK